MLTMVTAAWCRACGLDVGEQRGPCPHCGCALDPPAATPGRVGLVVQVPGRLGHRNGLVVRESAGTAQVLMKSDSQTELPLDQLDQLRQVDVPGAAVIGAAGRLWKALHARETGAFKAKWDTGTANAAAAEQAAASIGAGRAAALDALALGLHHEVGRLRLSEAETSWYRAWSAASAGNTASAIGWLERLPERAYPRRVALLMHRAADILVDPALARKTAELLAPFTGSDPDARVFRAALTAVSAAEVLNLLPSLAAAVDGGTGTLLATAAEVVRLEWPGQRGTVQLRAVRALDVYLEARTGSLADDAPNVLGVLPYPLIDELIERGMLNRDLAARVDWRAADAGYIRSRLDPGRASDADVAAARFVAEMGRRRFLAGDSAASFADLPDSDEAVRHYRALAQWRESARGEALEGVRPAAQSLLAQVGSLRAEATAARPATVPQEVAADPSCWTLIRENALQGALRLPPELRVRYPQFAEWLQLCRIQQLVFDRDWPAVISEGTDLAGRTALEATSDEAKNMVAFAHFQQGRYAEAQRVLDDALAGQYTTGLIVNAGIVAAATGSVPAMPYLARIVSLESDPAIRRGAITRAIDLWAQDADSPEYPDTLRQLVRRALAGPQPDELYQRMLRLAQGQDTAWLAADVPAGARDPVYVDSPVQADILRYRRMWARSNSDERPESLKDVAQVLVSMGAQPQPADWVQTELERFCKELDDALHCPFGEAPGLAAPIEVLLAGGVLTPVRQYVFALQAGAHLASYLAGQGGSLAPDAENRLIFDTATRFRDRKASLSEDDREYVSEEMARCVTAAAYAMATVIDRDFTQRSQDWGQLTAREQYDHQNQMAIRFTKRQILDELDFSLNRLRAYLQCLGDLPLNEARSGVRAELGRSLDNWTAETRRLRQFT